jgi:hypothetical protein
LVSKRASSPYRQPLNKAAFTSLDSHVRYLT